MPSIVDDSIAEMLGEKLPPNPRASLEKEAKNMIFGRMHTVCAGCPHRSSIYALKHAVKAVKGEPTKSISIEAIAKAVGVEHVEVVDAYDLKASEAAFRRMLQEPGVAMVISRRVCATEAIRRMRPSRPVPYSVDENRCIGCKLCLSTFGCPALNFDEELGKAGIDPTICMGCGVCSQVCAEGCIDRRN